MKFLYRISNNSYNKSKLANASKEACFINFIKNLLLPSDTLYVIADNVNEELRNFLKSNLPINGHLIEANTGSNGACFRLQLSLADQIPDNEIVFLHEDDYLYRPHAVDTEDFKLNNLLIREGLERSDYVSLYDHPDKYLSPREGGNPLISIEGVEYTGIFLTAHSHWKYTNSTTLTFAAKKETLIEDRVTWLKHCSGRHPNDFDAFLELGKQGRRLATCIPGNASNTEPPWLTPLYNWEKI